jgi:hypothetical protein
MWIGRSCLSYKLEGDSVDLMTKIYVVDRATGVRGTFCIERPCADNHAFSEYWNPDGWAGSGYVFTDEKLAYAVRDLLAYKQEHI